MRSAFVFLSFTGLLVGEIAPEARNLRFTQGVPGAEPPGWLIGPAGTHAYTAQIAAGAACHSGSQCGAIFSTVAGTSDHLSLLYQVVDATPYRGKNLKFRAAVRAQVDSASSARLLVRIRRTDGSTSFRDDMGEHPVTAPTWGVYQIDAPIAADARDIEFGIQLVGRGAAWIDDLSLDFASGPMPEAERDVRALIARFADSRNRHDGFAAAETYAADGKYVGVPGTVVRGHAALEALWGSMTGHAERTIGRIDFVSPDMARVQVEAAFSNTAERLNETFTVVRDPAEGWKISLHQAQSLPPR